ncbi:MAG: hypothetical protein MRK02_08280 [Candidatus Scalindua sp.]|nr:hypothetical protein [Candidatus Scalindua sp.]
MEKWKYKSLKWIHRIREEDYNNTANLSPKELIEKTRKAAENIAKELDLETSHSNIPSKR